jgi:hypothetical protein
MTSDSREHVTSIAVWDLPSPLVTGRAAPMKIGAKCSAGCDLSGQKIEVHDQTGRVVASAAPGPAAWPGTSGLYWAELNFPAPPDDGTYTWTATSVHGGASSEFTFITVKPPEHKLTVRVRDRSTQAGVPDVEVRLGVYRTSSDDRGLAIVELAGGRYDLTAWKMGYEQFSTVLDVAGTTTVDVEIEVEAEEKQPYWM